MVVYPRLRLPASWVTLASVSCMEGIGPIVKIGTCNTTQHNTTVALRSFEYSFDTNSLQQFFFLFLPNPILNFNTLDNLAHALHLFHSRPMRKVP
jgi:hypothetical protein